LHCFTGKDNETFDPARVAGYGFAFMLAVMYFCLFFYVTLKSGTFDLTLFAGGAGVVSGAITTAAVGVRVKQGSEP
jgi:hypothetical protein